MSIDIDNYHSICFVWIPVFSHPLNFSQYFTQVRVAFMCNGCLSVSPYAIKIGAAVGTLRRYFNIARWILSIASQFSTPQISDPYKCAGCICVKTFLYHFWRDALQSPQYPHYLNPSRFCSRCNGRNSGTCI